ncbi:MAG: hypothetical protein VX741_03070 [Pseudomonadota bacterium]|nr:hypothetical protein [Pseudomonadota bacterium]
MASQTMTRPITGGSVQVDGSQVDGKIDAVEREQPVGFPVVAEADLFELDERRHGWLP